MSGDVEVHELPCSAACISAAGPGCVCKCGGFNHRGRLSHAIGRARHRARTRKQAGRDQDREQRYRALHPSEIMGGGLIATRPRRARDVGQDEYQVAVQAWLDQLEASGHGDDVPAGRQASFWRSARTGRGWAAQVRSARGRRRGGARPLEDWMSAHPRPLRADFRGERPPEDYVRLTPAEEAELERDLRAAGW